MKVNIKKIGISIVLMFSFLATFAYDFEADGLYYTRMWGLDVAMSLRFL